jgi:steroid delta-isomerase-like uncharacterized protein
VSPEIVAVNSAHTLVYHDIAAWNSHDLARVQALYTADYTGSDVGEGLPLTGPEAATRSLRRYMLGFPDFRIQCEDIVSQDERVGFYWTARGTHQGNLMNIPATGRAVSVRGATFLTVRDGLIARSETVWDIAGFLRGVGLLPDL